MQPRIILGESHYDPITGTIHQKLALLIKEKHPDWKISFLDEMTPTTTIDSYLKEIDEGTSIWGHAAIFVQKQANINLFPENLNHPYFSTEPGKTFASFTKRHFANFTFKELLETLRSNNIEYRGVGSELISLETAGSEERLVELGVMLAPLQDKIMAEALSKQEGIVLSRMGLRHVDGVYEHISKNLPSEAICMYNIYSQPPLAEDKSEFEKRVRSGEKSFITPIDATGKSDKELDEIVNRIFVDIEKRQESLNHLSKPAEKLTLHEMKKNPVKKLIHMDIDLCLTPASSTHLHLPEARKNLSLFKQKSFKYGKNESEFKIIMDNMTKAKKRGLLKDGNQIKSLKAEKLTVESVFKHKNCIEVLKLKRFTLKDLDPLPTVIADLLLSDAGYYCLENNLITLEKANAMIIPDLEKFLKAEYTKKPTPREFHYG